MFRTKPENFSTYRHKLLLKNNCNHLNSYPIWCHSRWILSMTSSWICWPPLLRKIKESIIFAKLVSFHKCFRLVEPSFYKSLNVQGCFATGRDMKGKRGIKIPIDKHTQPSLNRNLQASSFSLGKHCDIVFANDDTVFVIMSQPFSLIWSFSMSICFCSSTSRIQ